MRCDKILQAECKDRVRLPYTQTKVIFRLNVLSKHKGETKKKQQAYVNKLHKKVKYLKNPQRL